MAKRAAQFLTCLFIAAATTITSYASEVSVFDLVRDSAWAVDVNSKPFGFGDLNKYNCEDPLHIELYNDDTMWKASHSTEKEFSAKIISKWNDKKSNEMGVVIQYADELRVDFFGNPQVWLFVMPDKDHFYWKMYNPKTGASFGKSKMRYRCSADMS